MAELRGQLRAIGRIVILVSQYNERVTSRLLDGALACCRAAGMADDTVDVVWLPGAFELGAAAAAAAGTGKYAAIVGLGCVVRGETAHFEFVAGDEIYPDDDQFIFCIFDVATDAVGLAVLLP